MDLNTFCIAPWLSVYRHTTGDVTPCCVFKGSLGNTNTDLLENIREGEKFNKVKHSLLAGEKIPECNQCWNDESLNSSFSLRKTLLDYYKNHIDDVTSGKNLPVLYLDYRPSNQCNLACKSCSSEYSNKWIKIEDELYDWKEGKPLSNKLDVLPLLNNYMNIYFAGGEPLITKEVYDIIEYLIEKNFLDTTISFNTNLTTLQFKEKNIINLLENFKKAPVIGASIDGFKDVFEYVRTGVSWNTIENNLRQVSNSTKIILRPSCTVGWMNLNSMIELHIWLYENNIIKNLYDFNINPMYGPYGAPLSNCPPWKKDELLKSLQKYTEFLNNGFNLHKNSIHDDWHKNALDGQITICKTMIENSKFDEKHFKLWIEKNLFIDDIYGRDIFSMPFMDEITKKCVEKIKEDFNKAPTFKRDIL